MSTTSDEQQAFTRPDQNLASRRDAAGTLADLLICARTYDRRAGASTDPDEWFRAESESLLQWADNSEKLLSAVEFGKLIEGFKYLDGGLEHQVLWKRKSGRIFKITKPPHFGHSWYLKDYVQNVIWCNDRFADDMRLEGVMQAPDGVSLVMSQPFIVGRKPTEVELKQWFELQGCIQISSSKWRYPDRVIVSDVNPTNLILSREGVLFPIDLHLENMKPTETAVSSGACE